jgi:hypothetical protein
MSLNLKEEKSRPALAYSTSQSFISFTPGFNRVAEARRALLPNRFNGSPCPMKSINPVPLVPPRGARKRLAKLILCDA